MNTLFLTAVTGEMCLNYLHGIKFRYGSPFKLFRDQYTKATGEVLPNNKLTILKRVEEIYKINGKEPHKLLARALEKAKG